MSLSIFYLASSENSVIAVGTEAGGTNKYLHTTDGFNWQHKNFPNLNNWQGATYGSGKYVVVNNDDVNNLYVSNRNGLDWTGYTIPGMHSNNVLSKPSFANNLFFLDSSMSDNQFFYSSDATNWFTGSFPINTNLEKVIYADNLNLYIGLLRPKTRNYLYSNNGINWNAGLFPIEGRWNDIAYDGTKFITLSNWSLDLYFSRTGLFSTNGINWNTLILPNNNYDNIIYNKNLNLYMIAPQPANPSGSVAISSNGFNWRETGEVNLNNNIITNFKDKFIQHGLDAIFSYRLYVHSKLPFTFENQESGNLYSPASTWSNGIGNANIGNWFFVDRAGTFRGIINTNQNGRTSIGNSGFFFAPSTGTAAFYVDAYFNLINPLINGQGISLNANYSWNGGMRGIEFKPGTDGPSTFRIEHGNGDDRIYLRGPSFQDQVISTNGFQQALNYNIVYRQTGMLFEARNYTNNNLVFSTGLPISQTIRQIHFYIGNIQATQAQQLNYGLGVNNLETHYKQKVPFYSSSSSSFSSSSSSSSPFSSSSSSFSSSSSSFSSSSSSNSSSSSSFSSSSSNFIPLNNWALGTTITGSLYQYLGSDLAVNNSGNILFIGSNDPNKSVSIYTGLNSNWNLNKIVTGFGWSGFSQGLESSLIAINNNGEILAVTDPDKKFVNIYTGTNSWNLKQTLTGITGTRINNISMDNNGTTIVVSEYQLHNSSEYGQAYIYTGDINNGWKLNQFIRPDAPPPSSPQSSNSLDLCTLNLSGNLLVFWNTNGGINSNRLLIYNKNINIWNQVSQINLPQNTNTQRSRMVDLNNDGTLICISEGSENTTTTGIQYIYTGINNSWSLKQTMIHNGETFGKKLKIKFSKNNNLLVSNMPTNNSFGLNIYSGSKNNGWNLIQRLQTGAFAFDIDENATVIAGSNPKYGAIFRESGIVFLYTGKNLFL